MDKETEERFIALETKFAYQEDFVSELQNIVVAQAKQIDKFQVEIKYLSQKLKDVLDSETDIPNRRPPHY